MNTFTGMTPEEEKQKKKENVDKMYGNLTQRQKEHYEDVPGRYRHQYLTALNHGNMATAIKAMCNQCFGYQELAAAIPECTSESCPLWAYRKGA